jgi:hypothetical protein
MFQEVKVAVPRTRVRNTVHVRKSTVEESPKVKMFDKFIEDLKTIGN